MQTLEPIELWNRPAAGALPGWVRGAIVAACAVTIAIAAFGARLVWAIDGHRLHVDPFVFRNGLAIVLAVVLAVGFLPRGRASRFARLAAMLPLVHGVVMVFAWAVFAKLAPKLETLALTTPAVDKLPIGAAMLMFGFASFSVALFIARKRRGETAHALVMLTLVHLLVLGVWAPLAARIWCGRTPLLWIRDGLQCPPSLIVFVLVPAFGIASVFTAFAIRRPEAMRRRRGLVITMVTIALVIALVTRIKAPNNAVVVYDNFIHVLFAIAFLAIGALVALAAISWLRSRPGHPDADDRTWCTGTISLDDEPTDVVGCIEIASWLRGPRQLLRPFIVATATGELPIPPGARLLAPVPLVTTVLRSGEAVVVMRTGDRVIVGGFVERTDGGDHPFRESSTLVPGPDGLVVTPATIATPGFTNVALTMWRPCLAYLLILTAVALPALVALFTPPQL